MILLWNPAYDSMFGVSTIGVNVNNIEAKLSFDFEESDAIGAFTAPPGSNDFASSVASFAEQSMSLLSESRRV